MKIGYFLSCEEYTPAELLEQARLAEQAGFESLWISDHFHPWNDEQGNSPFVWSMIGAISQVCSLPIETAVTCPTVRLHPAVVAQAAATSAVLTGGRFSLGVGSGEALNEHVTGSRWPDIAVRLDMLEEAVEVMRRLWDGGYVDHHGRHYTVENARLYTLPPERVPVTISGFGPKAAALAGRIGDGFVTVAPDADAIRTFREAGGEGKPVHAGYKVCWGRDEQAAVDIAHRTWPNDGLPGELAQVLPSPAHFQQASQLVTKDMVAESMACGPDLDRHVESFKPFAEVGVDVVHISQIGARHDATNAEGFFEFYGQTVLPRLRELA
jgi:G6PDH family F420-dependent oxidoreductase